jgi:hypothetical protein
VKRKRRGIIRVTAISKGVHMANTTTAPAVLPWDNEIEPAKKAGITKQEVTLPMVAGVLGLLFALATGGGLIASIANLQSGQDPRLAPALICGVLVTLFLSIGILGFYMHMQRSSGDKNTPDVLGTIMPHDAIFETTRIQLSAFGFQRKDVYRIVICLQNVYNKPCEVDLEFESGLTIPATQSTLKPAEAILKFIDVPLPAGRNDSVASFELIAKSSGAGGRRMRASYMPLRDETTHQMLLVAMCIGLMLTGRIAYIKSGKNEVATKHGFANGYGKWQAKLTPVQKTEPASKPAAWSSVPLWISKQSKPIDPVAAVLNLLK